jgi:hypothetical protein
MASSYPPSLGHDVSGATLSCPVFNYALPLFARQKTLLVDIKASREKWCKLQMNNMKSMADLWLYVTASIEV